MISPQTIEQITSRIDIIDVVGEFVKLKKRGANYLGLCPFHGEKSPSFTVSQSKEIYKCFGCGKSGNSITFLMEHEKYSYVEALKWLANRYGIEIEESEVSDSARQHMQVADSLHIINQFAQDFFVKQLLETQQGQDIALSYLEERGFNRAIIEKFGIGYNPDLRDSFSKAAIKNQFNVDLLLKSGLVRSYQDELQDNYRGRIIFPIHNNSGKVIGFGARIIGKKENSPKYINTPENEIYVKSKVLYGSYFARHSIDKNDECLLVEGYTDVVSLVQSGVENVVASGGTSLTVDQLRLIKKYTKNLTIVYDGDGAGIKAALRGIDMALEEGLNVQLVLIPDNEDPDSYVKKIGSTQFKQFVAESKKDVILFQLEILLKDAGRDIAKKNEVVNRIAESLSKINKTEDFTKQQEYIRQCSSLLKIDETGLTTLVNKYKRDSLSKLDKQLPLGAVDINGQLEASSEVQQNDPFLYINEAGSLQEKNILRVLLEFGLLPWNEEMTIAQYIFSELEGFPFEDKLCDELLELYRSKYELGQQPTTKMLLYSASVDLQNMITQITMSRHELSRKWDELLVNMHILDRDNSVQDALLSVVYYKLRKIKSMLSEAHAELEHTLQFEDQMRLLEVNKHLKAEEKKLTIQLGCVIMK